MALLPDFIAIFIVIWMEDFWHRSHKNYRGPLICVWYETERGPGSSSLQQALTLQFNGLGDQTPVQKVGVIQYISFKYIIFPLFWGELHDDGRKHKSKHN